MDNYKRSMKEKLTDCRNDRGLRQRAAAKEMGIPASTLNEYENGVKKPGVDNLIKLSQYYDVSADWLLGLSEYMTTKEDVKIAAKTTGLSAAMIFAIQALVLEKGLRGHLNRTLDAYDDIAKTHENSKDYKGALEVYGNAIAVIDRLGLTIERGEQSLRGLEALLLSDEGEKVLQNLGILFSKRDESAMMSAFGTVIDMLSAIRRSNTREGSTNASEN